MGKVWCWWRPETWRPQNMRPKKGQGAMLVLIVPVLGKQHMGGGSGHLLAPWPDGHNRYDQLPAPMIPACHRAPKWSRGPEQSLSVSPNGLDRLPGRSFYDWEVILLKLLCLNKHKMFKEVLFANSEAGVSKRQWDIFFCQWLDQQLCKTTFFHLGSQTKCVGT